MLLFIDRLPLHRWHQQIPGAGAVCRVSVSFPVLPAGPRPHDGPQPGQAPQRWVFDTGCTGEGFAWRAHLQGAGLNPAVLRAGPQSFRTVSGVIHVPVRKASLWLFSNIPALREHPYRIALSPGIPFVDATWPAGDPPDLYSPLLGLRSVLRAGLKVQVDSRRDTVSVWVPGPPLRGAWLWLRRAPSGFRTLPPAW